MPRRKKSQASGPSMVGMPAPELVDGVPVPVLEKRLGEIRRCKQTQGDANTAHASADDAEDGHEPAEKQAAPLTIDEEAELLDSDDEPSSEWQPAAARDDDPALSEGGKYYAEGRDAGLDGYGLDAKPYDAGSVPGGLWEAGWREGQRLRTAPPSLGSDRPAFPEAAA